MNRWVDEIADVLAQGKACMLVTVASVRGSAPRETGAKMIVTATETIGTIGGGQLEYQCTRLAAETLQDCAGREPRYVRKYPLGANCGQCCGGVVDMLFELIDERSIDWIGSLQRHNDARLPVVMATSLENGQEKFLISAQGVTAGATAKDCPAELKAAAENLLDTDANATQHGRYLLEPLRQDGLHVAVFGAGHVGAATVEILARLDTSVRWVDSRRKIFPQRIAENVIAISAADPALEVAAMPADSYYVIMTHSHPLDLEICARVLQRRDFAYCGLIGSLSKRRRFERLLRKQGVSDEALRKLVCPVGISGIDGKQPAEIALAVAAEILQKRDALQRANSGNNETPGNLRVL
jgi:xanthine dehydrogenase accessory factor